MAKSASSPAPAPQATTEITATAAMTLVMAGNSVYGITPAPPAGQNLVTWSLYNRGSGSVSARWDDLDDAVYQDPASILMPEGSSFTGIVARRMTLASDLNGGTVVIITQPPTYR